MLGTIFGKILKIFNTKDNRDRDLIKVQFSFLYRQAGYLPPQRTHTLGGEYLKALQLGRSNTKG